MTQIELKNISYEYSTGTPFEKRALASVSAKFEKGLITGIIGHTGSGKSTLAQLLNGLIKPSGGSVLLEGKDIWENPKKMRDICFRVGIVFQYPEYQLFEETVRADIAFGPKNMGLDEHEIKERVARAAECVGLDISLMDKSPFEISGGQKRRAAIAGVMAMEPSVLVLDEPTAGLDPVGRVDMFSAITKYRKDTGSTIIIISHSMEDMAKYADRLLVMNEGTVFAEGTVSEVFSRSDELEKIGLEVPQITRLISELKKSGLDLPPDIYTVGQAADAIDALLSQGGVRKC